MYNYNVVKTIAHFFIVLCVVQSIAVLTLTVDWYVNRMKNNEPKESVFANFSGGVTRYVSVKDLFEEKLKTVRMLFQVSKACNIESAY